MNKRSFKKETILVHIEDPGAANGLLPVSKKLLETGYNVELDLEGFAKNIKDEDLGSLIKAKNSFKNLEENKYEALITGTSENTNSNSFALIEKCRILGIPTFAFIDSPANSENRFSGGGSNPLKYAPNFLFVVDESIVSDFKRFGFISSNMLCIEHPHLETLFLKKQKITKASKSDLKRNLFDSSFDGKPILTFCSELSSGLDPDGYKKTEEYTLHSPKNLLNRTDVVVHNLIEAVNILNCKKDISPIRAILRLHPKQEKEEIKLFNKFDFISKDESSIDVCLASDLIIGMTSMIMVEAFELGLPVISILPREKEINWMHRSIRNKIPICTNFTDLLKELESFLDNLSSETAKDAPSNDYAPRDFTYIDFITDNIRDFAK